MKLVLLIEDKRLKDATRFQSRTPRAEDWEDVTVIKVKAEGDVYQIAHQLRAVAETLLPPQRWITGMPLPDEAQKLSKSEGLTFPDA